MRWLPLICLFMVSCGSRYVDPQFKPYYDSFHSRYNVSPYNISAHFYETKDNNRGYCSGDGIFLDRANWHSARDNEKEYLVFHELGHCVWNLKHIDDTILYRGFIIRASLMYHWDITDQPYYKELREQYLEALPKNRPITGEHT